LAFSNQLTGKESLMLSLTRRSEESLLIYPHEDIDPTMTVGELFSNGPIKVQVVQVEGNQVRLGVDAPRALLVMRDELVVEGRTNASVSGV
jgi:carbon storage regulator CsrA